MNRLSAVVLLACASIARAQTPPPAASPSPVKSGPQVAEHADMAESRYRDSTLARSVFTDVTLESAVFENVNLTGARFHNVNMSNLDVSGVQLGGAKFEHIGPPPGPDGKQPRQRPVSFQNGVLCDSTFEKVDLSGAKFTSCNFDGATIDGISITDLLKVYRAAVQAAPSSAPR